MEIVGNDVVDGNQYLSVQTSITAAGTTQGTATAIYLDVNNVTTVAAGTGVILPALAVIAITSPLLNAASAPQITVINNGANPLLIYPPNGQSIDGGATNAAISVSAGSTWVGSVVSTNDWETINNVLMGTANQITVTYGTGILTFAVASNPIWPGTASETIPSGTTAQRPGTPTDAMLRYNTDEDILEAYSDFTITTPVAFQRTELYRKRITWEDEFAAGVASNTAGGTATAGYGQLNWSVTGSATTTNSIITSTTDHPGVFSLGTGATSGNNASIHLGTAVGTGVIIATQVEYFCFLVSIPTITSITSYWGLAGTFTGTGPTTGVYFQYAPGTNAAIQFFTGNGTLAAAVNTLTPTANEWVLCEAFYNGTTWTPVVNGTAYTAQSGNIPTTAVNVGAFVQTGTGTARTLSLDFFSMYTRELGSRYT